MKGDKYEFITNRNDRRNFENESEKKYTSKQLAEETCSKFKDEFSTKRKNPRFKTDEDFVIQIQAEIGSHKEAIKKRKNVIIEEQTRPKLYFYDEDYNPENYTTINIVDDHKKIEMSEKDMYPILALYLKLDAKIHSKRIDELKSKNNRGPEGNKWLHPDLVGIEILDNNWNKMVSDCVKGSGGNRIRIYSYEVKKVITSTNLRESFFQAVSNSSWSNLGFLVAGEIKGNIFDELKMLSSLHGIGFILFDIVNPSESQILLQAKEKDNVDWESIDRLLRQNSDFGKFVQSLKVYYKSGIINENDWYKLDRESGNII
ncbi:MAG: hypothetical protein P1P69_09480 [Methanosarcinaceae archaeon]|nr:hypothetical protein [Methanosarcinaceae archaeon]